MGVEGEDTVGCERGSQGASQYGTEGSSCRFDSQAQESQEKDKPINPREKMTTPVVPRNSDMKSPSWLMEKLSLDPSW